MYYRLDMKIKTLCKFPGELLFVIHGEIMCSQQQYVETTAIHYVLMCQSVRQQYG
jgi:hypothetical protein